MPSKLMNVKFNIPKVPWKNVWRKIPVSLMILGISLVILIISIGLGIAAQLHDSKWNSKLETGDIWETIERDSTIEGKPVFNKEKSKLFYRDTWMKKAFLGITSFLFVSTIIHITVYILYDDEHYRYNFAILFAIVAVFLYVAAGVFMVTSTVANSNHYNEILALAMKKGIQLRNTTYLKYFEACETEQEATANKIGDERDINLLRDEADKLGICQLSEIRFAAAVLALLNVLWMGGVLLTTHSAKTAEEDALSHARDLEYDQTDEDWTAPLSTFRPGPRRPTANELVALPKADESGEISGSVSDIASNEQYQSMQSLSGSPPGGAH